VLLSICGNNGHCSDNSLTMVTVRLTVVYKEAYKTKRNSSHSETFAPFQTSLLGRHFDVRFSYGEDGSMLVDRTKSFDILTICFH
jgi:hypothetical protein